MRDWIYHFRLRDQNGSPATKGGVTVAVRAFNEKMGRVGTAVCSLKDNFCRRKGIAISTGRAGKSSTRAIPDNHEERMSLAAALAETEFLRVLNRRNEQMPENYKLETTKKRIKA